MLNVLTIDIEDYFQVHAFSKVIRYEDWDKFECRIERNTDRILGILSGACSTRQSPIPEPCSAEQASPDRNPVHATFFVLGWIAERYPDLIRRIRKEGHEIACHGYAHRLIYTQTREEFRQDIKRAKAILEEITGSEVIGYRAPSYSITSESRWAVETLIEEGFKYDSSIFPIRHDFYGMPEAPRFPFLISLNGNNNIEFSVLNYEFLETQNSSLITRHFELNSPINSINSSNPSNPINPAASALNRSSPPTSNKLIELPLSTVKLFGQNFPVSGGGYFRLFPYPLIRSGLTRINEEEKKPFIFYLHPWELDSDQPRVNGLSSISKFRHYVNLDKAESKFRRLLEDFQFSTVEDAHHLNERINRKDSRQTVFHEHSRKTQQLQTTQ